MALRRDPHLARNLRQPGGVGWAEGQACTCRAPAEPWQPIPRQSAPALCQPPTSSARRLPCARSTTDSGWKGRSRPNRWRRDWREARERYALFCTAGPAGPSGSALPRPASSRACRRSTASVTARRNRAASRGLLLPPFIAAGGQGGPQQARGGWGLLRHSMAAPPSGAAALLAGSSGRAAKRLPCVVFGCLEIARTSDQPLSSVGRPVVVANSHSTRSGRCGVAPSTPGPCCAAQPRRRGAGLSSAECRAHACLNLLNWAFQWFWGC